MGGKEGEARGEEGGAGAMTKLLAAAALILASAAALLVIWGPRASCATAGCKDTYNRTAPDENGRFSCGQFCTYTYKKHWIVYFMDGYQRRIDPEETGEVRYGWDCPPAFERETFVDDGSGSAVWL